MDDHVVDLIEEYALGTLDAPTTAKVRQHLAKCQSCQKDVQMTEKALAHLPMIVPQASPSNALRARLLASVSPPYSLSDTKVMPRVPRPSFWQVLKNWRVPAFVGLGVVLALILSNFLLWRQNNFLRTELEKMSMIVLPMHPLEEGSLATGILVMDPRGQFGTIVVDSLPPSREGLQYHIWLSKDGQVFTGGEFVVHESGYGAQIIYMPEPLHLYNEVWLTVEPEAGSEQPTGDIVLQTD